MTGLLPPSILNRPKMGFPVPFATWTRGPWHAVARDVLLDRRTRERGIFDPDGIERLLRDHIAGRTDGGDRIWSLLNLELWYRTFIDREGIQTLPEIGARAVRDDRSWGLGPDEGVTLSGSLSQQTPRAIEASGDRSRGWGPATNKEKMAS